MQCYCLSWLVAPAPVSTPARDSVGVEKLSGTAGVQVVLRRRRTAKARPRRRRKPHVASRSRADHCRQQPESTPYSGRRLRVAGDRRAGPDARGRRRSSGGKQETGCRPSRPGSAHRPAPAATKRERARRCGYEPSGRAWTVDGISFRVRSGLHGTWFTIRAGAILSRQMAPVRLGSDLADALGLGCYK